LNVSETGKYVNKSAYFWVLLLISLGIPLRDFQVSEGVRFSEIFIILGFILLLFFCRKHIFDIVSKLKSSQWAIWVFLPFALSDIASQVLSATNIEWFKKFECVFLLFFACLLASTVSTRTKTAILTAAIAASAVALVSLVQFCFHTCYFFEPYTLPPDIMRSSSILRDPNYCGLYLSIVALFACNLQVSGRVAKIFVYLALLILFIGVGLTFSRSALISLITGSCFVLFYLLTASRIDYAKIVLIVISIVLLTGINQYIRKPVGDLDSISSGRIEKYKSWSKGESMFNYREFLFGKGPATSPALWGLHFHNNYMTILYERGIIGFLTFYAFWIYWILRLFGSAFKRLKQGQDCGLHYACIGAICGWLAASFFLDTSYELIIWFVLGIAISAECIEQNEKSDVDHLPGRFWGRAGAYPAAAGKCKL
jgi:O-antigen ligase